MCSKKMPPGSNVIAATFSSGLWALLFGISIYYILDISPGKMNSDAAVYYVLAQEILRTGTLIPPDWNYVNGDLMIFTKPLIIVALDHLGITGLDAFHASGIVLLCAASFMTFAVLLKLRVDMPAALIGAGIPLVPFSENYLAQANVTGFYLTWYVHLLILFYLAVSILSAPGRSRLLPMTFAFYAAVLFLLAVENPVRVVFYFGMPALIACLVVCLVDTTRAGRELKVRAIYVAAASIVLTLCAAALHESLAFRNMETAAAAELVPLRDVPFNLLSTAYGLAVLAGFTWEPGAPLFSVAGIVSAAKSIMYAATLALPLYCTIKHRQLIAVPGLLFAAFAFAGILIIGIAYSLTTLQVGGIDEVPETIRYLFPFFLLTLVCNVPVWKYQSSAAKSFLSLAFVLVVSTSSLALDPAKAHKRLRTMEEVMNMLGHEGVATTYAPYWNSHIYTLLSSGELEVRPVALNGQVDRFRILQSGYWYDSANARGRTAFLFPREDEHDALTILAASCYGEPDRHITTSTFDILVYEENPASQVFGGLLANESGKICFDTRSYRHVGTPDVRQNSITATPDAGSGFLHFGPYARLDCGRYSTTFQLEAESSNRSMHGDLGFVDVVHDKGNHVLGRKGIPGGQNTIGIIFDVPREGLNDIEFRVYSMGVASLLLSGITVESVHPCRL